jgi:hypothetical protein
MSEIKNLCLRLSYEEYEAFDSICRERGFSKTGKIREFIRNLIKEELPAVRVSSAEWSRIAAGIREIERGEYLSFERLKRRVGNRKMGNHKNRQVGKSEHRRPG